MREINSDGSVSGEFVDYVEGVTPGTLVNAQWGNDVQADLIAIQDKADVAQGPGSDELIYKSILRIAKEKARPVGAVFTSGDNKTPGSWDILTPENYFPAVNLSTLANPSSDLAVASWPDLVPLLRSVKLRYLPGQAGEVSEFPGTVAGSVATLDDTAANNAFINHLVDWQLSFGSYTDWVTVTIAGVEYVVTALDAALRTITVSGSPATGAQDVSCYHHRVAGSTTSARVYRDTTDVTGAPTANLYKYLHGGRYSG